MEFGTCIVVAVGISICLLATNTVETDGNVFIYFYSVLMP